MADGIELKEKITVTRLKSAFYFDIPKDFGYDGERHSGWEFVYVERGKVSAIADDARYILKSGEMVCHKPMEFHSIEPYQENAAVIIFCFECDGEEMRYFNNKIISVTQRQKQYLNDIVRFARKLLIDKDPLKIAEDGAMERAAGASIVLEHNIKNTIELLVLSLLSAETVERKKRVESFGQYTQRRSLTEDIIFYLNENLRENITLKSVSDKFSYSMSSVKRIFKAETGYSLINYLQNLRIEKAKEMLSVGKMPIEVISNAVGFSSVYYFSNTFKRLVGETPSEYRRNSAK